MTASDPSALILRAADDDPIYNDGVTTRPTRDGRWQVMGPSGFSFGTCDNRADAEIWATSVRHGRAFSDERPESWTL